MMTTMTREINREQYERAINNHRILTEEDRDSVFSISERFGYGVYGGTVFEEHGKYYVLYSLGSTCD